LFSGSLGRPVCLEAGLYSCGLKCHRFIGVCRDREQVQSWTLVPGLTLRCFGEYDVTIAFFASQPIHVVKTLDLSSMRDFAPF